MRHDAAVSATRARMRRAMVIARRAGVASLLLGFSACGNSAAGNGPASSAVVVVPVAAPVVEAAPAPSPAPSATPSPTPSATPTPAPSAAAGALKGIVAEGDSISLFWGGSYTGIFAREHPSIPFKGMAVSGSHVTDAVTGNGLVERLPQVLAARPALVTVLIGTNDLGASRGLTPVMWLNNLWAYVAAVKATGAKVVVGTVLPICLPQYRDYNDGHSQQRPVVNDDIRAAVGTRIDGVFDVAADPVMGSDAAACDTALYSDGLHPTARGQELIAKLYTRAVEAALAK